MSGSDCRSGICSIVRSHCARHGEIEMKNRQRKVTMGRILILSELIRSFRRTSSIHVWRRFNQSTGRKRSRIKGNPLTQTMPQMGVFRVCQGAVWFPNDTFRSANHWAARVTEGPVWLGFRFLKCTDELHRKDLTAKMRIDRRKFCTRSPVC